MSTPTPKQHEEPSATNELITVDSNFMRRATQERDALLAENTRLREALAECVRELDAVWRSDGMLSRNRWAQMGEDALAAGKGEGR